MSDDDGIEIELYGDEEVRVLINDNVKMTSGKRAAQAVHAALFAYGIPHGRVVVLGGKPRELLEMQVQVRDAGRTEIAPGTMTAGASIIPSQESACPLSEADAPAGTNSKPTTAASTDTTVVSR